LVTHLGKECATCSSGTPAGHVLTREQQQLLSRAADLEAEQRQHAAAANEAARIAAAAAARASELEAEIRVEISERRTTLLQQEEVGVVGWQGPLYSNRWLLLRTLHCQSMRAPRATRLPTRMCAPPTVLP
jgi:phage protein D